MTSSTDFARNSTFGLPLILKWFKLFGLKRKLTVLRPDESFFELHSWATEQEKGRGEPKKSPVGFLKGAAR